MDLEDILELAELADQLLEPLLFVDHQQDHAARPVVDRQAEDAFDVEAAPGEEAADVRHDTRDDCAPAAAGWRWGER